MRRRALRLKMHRDRPGNRCPGFSLLEIVIVLALMGVAAGLVAPAVMRHAGVSREQRAIGELVTTLATRRLDAIRTGRVETIALRRSTDDLVIGMNDAERVAPDWPLTLSSAAGSDADSIEISFDARGRADVDRVLFRSVRTPSRMWAVVFDPVGGVPTAQRVTEATTP